MDRLLCRLFVFMILLIVPFASFAQGHGPMFDISAGNHMEGWTQVCHNPNADEYLAAWEDYRNSNSDIYGQLLNSDGTQKGDAFPICEGDGHQYWPRMAFDPIHDQFLVVFEDHRDGSGGDISGTLVSASGALIDAPTSGDDHSFAICTNPAAIYTCSVAFDLQTMRYLAVWGDRRNDPQGSFIGVDVFGQIIDYDGTLLSPPNPADPATNFPVAAHQDIEESVADVTYCLGTGEWLVVYGQNNGFVGAQRVNADGNLVLPDGTIATGLEPTTGMIVSREFQNGPDCLQARVKSNNEFLETIEGWIECEVVWKGKAPELPDNDVWGQRIGFFMQDELWVAEYVDIDGDITEEVSNHPISIQDGWCGPPDIDFSVADNEFLVSWGDPRDEDPNWMDLYYQRLCIDATDSYAMQLLDDDRENTVTEFENIPVFTTLNYEGSMLGIAHSSAQNQFLVAFTYEDSTEDRDSDIMGVIASGSPPISAETHPSPETITIGTAYPNPFVYTTTISLDLPRSGHVLLSVYDLAGRRILNLLNGKKESGRHDISWDGRDARGCRMAPGMYIYEIAFGGKIEGGKVVLFD